MLKIKTMFHIYLNCCYRSSISIFLSPQSEFEVTLRLFVYIHIRAIFQYDQGRMHFAIDYLMYFINNLLISWFSTYQSRKIYPCFWFGYIHATTTHTCPEYSGKFCKDFIRRSSVVISIEKTLKYIKL